MGAGPPPRAPESPASSTFLPQHPHFVELVGKRRERCGRVTGRTLRDDVDALPFSVSPVRMSIFDGPVRLLTRKL